MRSQEDNNRSLNNKKPKSRKQNTLRLLKQNSELRADRVWNWTLPAFGIRLQDGRTMNVCPNAGACASVCYARNGTYNFSNVKTAHERNLLLVLDHLEAWTELMIVELQSKRFEPNGIPRKFSQEFEVDAWAKKWMEMGGVAVRIHDSGDFFNSDYLKAWCKIAGLFPNILFYCYTKEVTMFRDIATKIAPPNFRWIYSMGGKQDHLINKETERHAEVFPTEEMLINAGYMNQDESDLLAILLPTTKIGIPANNIPAFNKKLDGRTFGQLQEERNK